MISVTGEIPASCPVRVMSRNTVIEQKVSASAPESDGHDELRTFEL